MKQLRILAYYGQNAKACPVYRKTVALLLLLSLQPVMAKDTVLDSTETGFQSFPGFYEPSGVIQLYDQSLLIIEDEPSRPFARLISQATLSNRFEIQPLVHQSALKAVFTGANAPLNDLEGLVQGPQGFVYAITSHSRQNNGSRDLSRERLVQLKVEANKIVDISIRDDLRDALVTAYPQLQPSAEERRLKDHAGLNIEGLTFNRSNDAIWIGFRAPLIDGKAIVTVLENPIGIFVNNSDYRFSKKMQYLDLDGGGIRDIAFDPILDGYVIVSQREGTKKEKAFKLWFWSGERNDIPKRIKISGIKNIRRTEGVAPITLGSDKFLLLVSDEGDYKRSKSAKYLLVKYADLTVEQLP